MAIKVQRRRRGTVRVMLTETSGPVITEELLRRLDVAGPLRMRTRRPD